LVEYTYTGKNSSHTNKNISYLDVLTSTFHRKNENIISSSGIHAHDSFLGTSTTYCAKNRMKKRCSPSSNEV